MSWKTNLKDLPSGLLGHAEKACEAQMAKNPVIKSVHLKGTKLHKSHDGSGKNVISIQMLNADSKRVETIHVQEDGTTDVQQKNR